MTYIKLSSKNQIVLPKEAREAMKVKGGDSLLVVVKGDITLLMPRPKEYARALLGRGKGIYPKDYLKKERRSW
ncbi:MAG: AbrB/MazE/SpoVT family DNA-binding domain-containing protein [Nitrospirae bacterium]|nr:AbrB/MazE/SpoVT family DNA-binding domain-containing protein [Nitrospirota bacterium]